ncbi:MAG: hypothetical protein CMG66_01750 [Candidatus Marinimicrobia bacterium]|nr:hypothetical protein [Candidatus Neomarinimicrobiota bacterium]|tara:strand:- start:6085 stop:6375 length:291 start_codon:yes stop_codon:yes gene_type:complete
MKSINLFKKELAILWEDNQETIISYSLLRQLCPCAFCSGETDALGKKYGGQTIPESEDVFVVRFKQIGYYGLQFFFSDGHKDGIYTFDFLKKQKTQ